MKKIKKSELRKLIREELVAIESRNQKKSLKSYSDKQLLAIWNKNKDERVGATFGSQLKLIAKELKRRGIKFD